ncbi:cell division protein CrgA [Egicoccus sp. AB-alg6-2]|uniref:cell division protein CrgA n=1 Tax=Egicoccus sp. AB-alg6-2 TaxID=3242692 RepID=UPI00359D9EFD
MPQSKHRRKGRNRPRAYQTSPPAKNPAPSAPWVPKVGVGLLVAGVAVILLAYLPTAQDWLATVPPLYGNWGLVVGFALLIAGFGFLVRWR